MGKAFPLAGYYTSCGNIHDGILAYRLAGFPLTLNLLIERGFDLFRSPENRVVQNSGAELSTWELRHQITHILLLLRLPFLFTGCVLGGCIWWVTRRLYGNLGGNMALALYCFSPAVLKACVAPNPDVLAALGVFGGVYTCIGVAHSMQGPRKKWRPRIVLLIVHLRHRGSRAYRRPSRRGASRPCRHVLDRRRPPESGAARRSHSLNRRHSSFLFACYGFSPDAFSYVFRSSAGFLWFSIDPARYFFSTLSNGGVTLAACAVRSFVSRHAPNRTTSATLFLCSARPSSSSSS